MSTSIISCPNCATKMRVPADRHIRFNCTGCPQIIEVNNGRVITPRATANNTRTTQQRKYDPEAQRKKDDQAMLVKRIMAGLAVLLVGFITYNLMTKETRAYEELAANPTTTMANRYLRDYPNGEYRAFATRVTDSIAYTHAVERRVSSKASTGFSSCLQLQKAKTQLKENFIEENSAALENCLWDNVSEYKDFASLEAYKENFPTGKYSGEVAAAEAEVWSNLRDSYAARVKDKEVSKAARLYMNALLDYAEKTGERTVNIAFNSETNLKDWSDYTEEERSVVDMMIEFSNASGENKYPLPSKSKPPSIKQGFQASDAYGRQGIVKAFQVRLDSVFLPGTFEVVNLINVGDAENMKERPLISVDYKIETLAEKYESGEFPTLYVHTETNGQYSNQEGRFIGYLLATGIDWNVNFTLPQRNERFKMNTYSRPNNSFSNIGGGFGSRNVKNDAYRKMLTSAFQNYATMVASEIGL